MYHTLKNHGQFQIESHSSDHLPLAVHLSPRLAVANWGDRHKKTQ